MLTLAVRTACCASLCLGSLAYAAEPAPGIVGKNDWLYYRYELTDSKDNDATMASIDLIARLNRILARNNVTMAVVMVPIKMRIHPENLPADIKINDYMANSYDRMADAFRAAKVNFIDLNTPFLKSQQRNGETPLFLRQDTHWGAAGSLFAAESVRAGVDANPTLKNLLTSIPEEKFTLVMGKRKSANKVGDLVDQLPKGSPAFTPEQIISFSVNRPPQSKDSLLSDDAAPAITLMGSSYSHNATGFSEALRYTLQRDLLDISVGADRGSWLGMESYLRDAAFQTQKPKLLIWEMPERDMKALPNSPFRDARYISDNTEWLLRAAAWAQEKCSPSPVKTKINPTGFTDGAASKEGDFIEIEFDQPLAKLDYLSVDITSNGSKQLVLEAGSGTPRKFTSPIADDNMPHIFKMPLPATGGAAGFTKLKLYPGKSKQFSIKQLQVCRHSDDFLS
jgi:alginate O-acetyltransferase complex protein AlgJ